MPIPIRPLFHEESTVMDSHGIDYSVLFQQTPAPSSNKKMVQASNRDATVLFELWSEGRKDGDTFKVGSIDQKDIIRLKTRGLISGGLDNIRFTNKGRAVISTMALAEPNKFESRSEHKNYNEILADMNKKGKPGYRIPKMSTNSSNNIRL